MGMRTLNEKIIIDGGGGNVWDVLERITPPGTFVLDAGNQGQISGTELRQHRTTYNLSLIHI